MPTKSVNLYEKAVEVSIDYLGPAGERFIRRQISTHIGIEPEKLKPHHIPQLVNWVGLAYAMITNNKNEVEDFTYRLMSLGNTR